ncbi:MAG TPA: trimethylamine methyltransferase family protein [Coriobacteriia bacterium]
MAASLYGGAPRRALRPRLSMLDAADIEYVHEQSLRLLAEVGIRVGSARALKLLAEAGAQVDAASSIARLPASLVAEALAKAPRIVLLAARDAKHDALLDHTRLFATHDGMAAMTLDHRTGERRPSTARDLVEAMTLADALDEVGVCWYTVYPCDEDPRLQSLRGLQSMLVGSSKHVQGEVVNPADVPYVMDMLSAASDDGVWHRERPIFSIVYCPVSPLQHDGESLDAAIMLAQQGVPITMYSLAQAGTTSPITLAGTVVQTNAEMLATIVILQTAAPGCPLIYVANAGVADTRSGMYAAAGPEGVLLDAALTEVGKHYGLPVLSCGFSSDAKEIGMQSGVEGATMALCTYLAGADLVTGIGLLDSAQLLSLPKLVLDAEVIRHCRRVVAGLSLDDDHVLFDVMARVGPGGQFLSAKEARPFLRNGEHLVPQHFVRGPYDTWAAAATSEFARAATAVDDILATHQPKPLPAGAAERIEEIAAAAAAEQPMS